MSLFDVYKKGWDAQAFFVRVCKVLHSPQDNPRNIWETIKLMDSKLAWERGIWERCRQPQPDSERLKYERIVADHQRAIQGLADHAKMLMKEFCVHREVFSVGYFQEKPNAAPVLTVINPEIWPLLNIDFENSAAAGEGFGFKAVRFVHVMDLTNDDRSVIEGALSARTEDVDANPVAQLEADKDAKPKGGRPPGQAPVQLEEILTALEKWCGDNNESFDRKSMPGQVGKSADDEASFHWFCAKLYPKLFMKSSRAFEDHRGGLCAFPPYPRKSDFYRRALPHIAQIMGVSVNVTPLRSKQAKTA